MNEEQEGFLEAIKQNEWDETLRHIYADWLMEHDQPEESERQRKIVPSMLWLQEFADRYGVYGGYAGVTKAAQYFSGDKDDYLCIPGNDSDTLAETWDEELLAEFWKNIGIIEGKPVSKMRSSSRQFSCSC